MFTVSFFYILSLPGVVRPGRTKTVVVFLFFYAIFIYRLCSLIGRSPMFQWLIQVMHDPIMLASLALVIFTFGIWMLIGLVIDRLRPYNLYGEVGIAGGTTTWCGVGFFLMNWRNEVLGFVFYSKDVGDTILYVALGIGVLITFIVFLVRWNEVCLGRAHMAKEEHERAVRDVLRPWH